MLSHAILRSSCEINIRYYPFDQQLCVMSFSSWSQDITQVGAVKTTGYIVRLCFFLQKNGAKFVCSGFRFIGVSVTLAFTKIHL